MKNRQCELRRRLAREYHRNAPIHQFVQGVLVRHDYCELAPDELSWWDDTQFILGRMRVAVSWRHPRHVYKDMIGRAADEATQHLYDKIEGDLFDEAERTYRKLGRSRKKVVSYTMVPCPGQDEWYEALQAEEIRLSKEANYTVVPSIKVEQLAWCRFVEIVAPLEVRNIAELQQLAYLVRRILKQETTLVREFPGYVYGKEQWVADGLAENPQGVKAHGISGS